jgi:predicted DCC family thiol-disulfide oxidoreductase YuxK
MLYDGDCRLCRWAARAVDRLDRHEQVALLSLSDDEALGLLASVPEEARYERWWLVRRDGTVVPGDDGGGVELLKELRLTRRLGRVLERLGASALIDALDRLVSRRRGQLGRLVPDGTAPRRYP